MSRNKLTAIQAIRAWYQSDEETPLTEHQEEKRQRLLKVIALMKNKTNRQIVKTLVKNYGISSRVAYRDIKDAIALYGDLRKAEKEGLRFILLDMAQRTFHLAAKGAKLKEMNAAIANMIKITGVDREDPDVPDFGELQPSLIIPVIPAALEMAIVNQLKQGPVDLSKAYQQYAETIEYEPAGGDEPTNQEGSTTHP